MEKAGSGDLRLLQRSEPTGRLPVAGLGLGALAHGPSNHGAVRCKSEKPVTYAVTTSTKITDASIRISQRASKHRKQGFHHMPRTLSEV